MSDKGDDSSIAGRGVVTVGATLAHRFYMRRSFRDFPRKVGWVGSSTQHTQHQQSYRYLALAETIVQLVTPTIFFLAAKVEEQPVKLRYITNACLQKYLNLDSSKLWDPHAESGVREISFLLAANSD